MSLWCSIGREQAANCAFHPRLRTISIARVSHLSKKRSGAKSLDRTAPFLATGSLSMGQRNGPVSVKEFCKACLYLDENLPECKACGLSRFGCLTQIGLEFGEVRSAAKLCPGPRAERDRDRVVLADPLRQRFQNAPDARRFVQASEDFRPSAFATPSV